MCCRSTQFPYYYFTFSCITVTILGFVTLDCMFRLNWSSSGLFYKMCLSYCTFLHKYCYTKPAVHSATDWNTCSMLNYRLKHLQHSQLQIETLAACLTTNWNTSSMLSYRLKHLQHAQLQIETPAACTTTDWNTCSMLKYKLKHL
jgi:hypothetical protein